MQYLAGYVVFKLVKLIKKCKEYNSFEKEYTVTTLAGMRTKDFADQKLIHFLACGDLYAVTPECQALCWRAEEHFRIEKYVTSIHRINSQALFCRAEEHFRIEKNVTSIHRINIEQITESLMKDKDVISTYNSIVENF